MTTQPETTDPVEPQPQPQPEPEPDTSPEEVPHAVPGEHTTPGNG